LRFGFSFVLAFVPGLWFVLENLNGFPRYLFETFTAVSLTAKQANVFPAVA